MGYMRHAAYALALVTGSSLFFAGAKATAEDYPNRSISFVIPFGPGGNTDAIGRIIADGLSKRLGQSVVVENREGGGGNIATGAVANAKPDGYTLLLANSGPLTMNPLIDPRISYDPRKDFTPISLMARYPLVLMTSKAQGVKTVAELIEKAKAQPGKLVFGSSGVNSHTHVLGEMLQSQGGVKFLHVPYKGGAAVLTAVMSGEATMFFGAATTGLSQIEAGDIVALAVTGDKRLPELPNVPTFAEAGFPMMKSYVWIGAAGPKAMPAAITDRISKEICGIIGEQKTKDQFAKLNAEPICSSPAEFASYISGELQFMGGVLNEIGMAKK